MKSLFLTVTALALLLSLCNCQSSTPDDSITTDPPETVPTIHLVSEDKDMRYTIIRPDLADDLEVTAAMKLRDAIQEQTYVRLTLTDDWLSEDDQPDPESLEILVGSTNRPQTAQALAALPEEGGAVIQVIAPKIIIAGTSPELTLQAVERFIQDYLTEEKPVLRGDLTVRYGCKDGFFYVDDTNKDKPSASDPWIISDNHGGYYYCWSGGGINVAHIENLTDLQHFSTLGKNVWSAPSETSYTRNIWAPELHCINGEWYIYFAADDGNNDNHRMFVLQCTGDDPTMPFRFVGQITDPTDRWAIDGTVLNYQDELYFIWSGWEGTTNVAQHLYIAHMSSPTEIDSERVRISSPTLSWEIQGGSPAINEGPTALVKDGKVFVTYSGSGSWCDEYCVGLLTLNGDDPMKASAWEKSLLPIMSKTAGTYGPGHASFAEAPDGRLWIFYHANEVSGSGWGGRSLRMQPVAEFGETLRIGSAKRPNDVIRIPIKGLQLTEEPLT